MLTPARPATAGAGEKAAAKYAAKSGRSLAYCAVRLRDGAVIASRAASTPMRPASVQKIVTSATALTVLGESFQFRTTLAVCGSDVIVLGDGDPTFGDGEIAKAANGTIYDVFDTWARTLVDRPFNAAGGNLILDDNIFQERRHPDWPADQHQRWYCAAVSGLNFNDNCIDVRLRRQGGAIDAEVSPASRFIHIDNQLRAGSKQLWRVRYNEDETVVRLTGQAKASTPTPLSVAVNQPTMLFGRVLADRLIRAGAAFDGDVIRRKVRGATGKVPAQVRTIAEHVTPLATVLKRANKRSLNMMAECLALRAAVAAGGRGTFADAARVTSTVLTDRFGIRPDQFVVADGSGMSRTNRLSPTAAVEILREMVAPGRSNVFLASLPVAGVDGTLAKRLSAYRGRVAAKTGTLAGTVGLAGYLLDKNGRPVVAFAAFSNHAKGSNWDARQVIDALVADWIVRVDAGVTP